jgi:transposase-like protein
MKCPHCPRKGTPRTTELIKREGRIYEVGFVPQPYDCPNCGREWIQDKDGNWESKCCTDQEKWSPDGKKLLERYKYWL